MSITKEQQMAYNALLAIDALKTSLGNIGLEITVNNTFADGREISFDALNTIERVTIAYAKIVFNEQEGSDLNAKYN